MLLIPSAQNAHGCLWRGATDRHRSRNARPWMTLLGAKKLKVIGTERPLHHSRSARNSNTLIGANSLHGMREMGKRDGTGWMVYVYIHVWMLYVCT